MLKLMWQKGDKRGVVGGGEKNLQLLLGLGGILHTWWHLGDGSRKDGQVTQASRYFQLLITNAEEKKKSSSHVFSMWGGGQAIHIQGSPQRAIAKRMVLNLQINQKTLPGELKKGY